MPSFANPDTSFFNETYGGPVMLVEDPPAGSTIKMGFGDRLVFVNAAMLASLTIRLPPGVEPGEIVELGFETGCAALTIRDAVGGSIASAPTSAVGPGAAIYMRYISRDYGWLWWDGAQTGTGGGGTGPPGPAGPAGPTGPAGPAGPAGSANMSGMTAGQIPIAATATTVTSSGNLSGDVATSNSLVTTLATVNGNTGVFQGLTLDGKGRVTAAVNQNYITAATAPVQSVAGKTGAVTLVKADVGLANVDNTSDAAKPISTATQTALNLKAPIASPTFTGKATTAASVTGGAGLNLPHGAAPTSPVNGDLWTTTAGLYLQVNGGTVGPYGAAGGTGMSGMTAGQIPIAATASTVTSSGNLSGDVVTSNSLVTALATVNANVGTFQGLTLDAKGRVTAAVNQSYLTTTLAASTYAPIAGPTFTGKATTAASATGSAGLRLPHGAAPTSPADGDLWTTTVGLYARVNGVTVGPYGVTGGSGSSVTISDTAPSSPAPGDLWWDSVSGNLFIRYNDGSSTQWVVAVNQAGVTGPPGPAGPAGSAAVDYSLAVPTTGQTLTVPAVAKYILNPAGALATLTLNLSGAVDKQAIRITARQRVDTLTIISTVGDVVDWTAGEIPQNGVLDFTYVSSLSTWVRA